MNELKGILLCALQKRQALNASYSRNAFARDLGVSPTALSQFLSGKRRFSRQNTRRIVDALCLPPDLSFRLKSGSGGLAPAVQLKIETFSLISDWYHYGILNLVEVDEIKRLDQIESRLGISKSQASAAVQRLRKLNLLKLEKGIYRRTGRSLDAGTDIPSQALRKHNREKMELAIEALEKVPLISRDISSLTLSCNPLQMDEVKKEIKRFKNRINQICAGQKPAEVYSLNIQFFPLTKKELES